MSADIISLQEWRRKHCEHHQHETMSVSFPFILPTWPCGWLLPMLVEIDVSIIAAFGALATCFSGQTSGGGLSYLDTEARPDRDNHKSAAIHRLFPAPAAKENIAPDR